MKNYIPTSKNQQPTIQMRVEGEVRGKRAEVGMREMKSWCTSVQRIRAKGGMRNGRMR
jgi:hypothetical protein